MINVGQSNVGQYSLVDFLARILGIVLIFFGVFGFSEYPSSDSDIVIGFSISLIIAGLATVFLVKKKTKVRRIITGILNGLVLLVGLYMLSFKIGGEINTASVVLGVFIIIPCGLSIAVSILPQSFIPYIQIDNNTFLKRLEKLKIGDTIDETLSLIGKPTKQQRDKDGHDRWIYETTKKSTFSSTIYSHTLVISDNKIFEIILDPDL
ncbi:MAG: hypothetical protein ABSB91_06855 [Sedimentisphaerales bacterium]|jgi:hypothetical protein